jgi:hypothetical protein
MKTVISKTMKSASMLLLVLAFTFVVGCKSSTEPQSTQEYDSEAAADMQATAVGTDAGGAGVNFLDAHSLMTGGDIPDAAFDSKGATPQTKTKSFDSVTKLYTVVITREGSKNNFSFSADVIYTYTFYDAAGVAMNKFVKGQTDKIVMNVSKQRAVSKGDRLDATDSANGSWTITNIISGVPILNGNYARNGSVTFHTEKNGDKSMTHSLSMQFLGDTLIRQDNGNDKYAYLKGPATSHFEATTAKGVHIIRDTKITFNGDGTATLEVTRTSGDGTVDTYTIDVKVGKWLRKGIK